MILVLLGSSCLYSYENPRVARDRLGRHGTRAGMVRALVMVVSEYYQPLNVVVGTSQW